MLLNKSTAVADGASKIAIHVQEYLSPETLGDDLNAKGRAFNVDVSRLHGHLGYLAGKKHVLGLILCGTTFGWGRGVAGRPRIEMAAYTQVLAFAETPAEEEFGRRFFKTQGDRVAEWIRDHA